MAARHNFSKGDRVEVWSNGRKEWMKDGVVDEVLAVSGDVAGMFFEAGALKVSSGAGSKWIKVEDVGSIIRKCEPAAPLAAPAPAVGSGSSSGQLLCKHGCGRPVQPGFTRYMNLYDTCCKKCAKSPGQGLHDENCGGYSAITSPTARHGPNPKEWFQKLLGDEQLLHAHADTVYDQLEGGEAGLEKPAVKRALEKDLFEPIGIPLAVPEKIIDEWTSCGSSTVKREAFQKLARYLIADRHRAWFNEKLWATSSSFICRNPKFVTDVYDFGKKLGEGSYGKVYSVTQKISGEKRVVKMISKTRAAMSMEEILGEIQNMAMLDHPNVLKIYEYFEDEDNVSQILEPCNGGELQDRIDEVFRKKGEPYTEEFMCDVMKQLLRALAFMHANRYMHKDLKPQNIMMVEKGSSSIKVIDFGMAELFAKDQKVSKNWGGTTLYMAPEVFTKALSMKSDIWSAGCILYNLICGGYPFIGEWPLPRGKDVAWWEGETQRKITDRKIGYAPHPAIDGNFTPACKNLLGIMLTKEEKNRPNASQCLAHEWFTSFERTPPPLGIGVTQCLEAFASQPEFKKCVFLLCAHQCTLPAAMEQELRAIFTHFDLSNTGTLPNATIREVLQRSGQAPLNVERIVHALDKDESGDVAWTEFIAAALCIKLSNEKKLLEMAFTMFDRNGDGKFNVDDVLQVFAHAKVPEATREQWKKRAPVELQALDKSGTFTKENFDKYFGARITVTPGDLLRPVS